MRLKKSSPSLIGQKLIAGLICILFIKKKIVYKPRVVESLPQMGRGGSTTPK